MRKIAFFSLALSLVLASLGHAQSPSPIKVDKKIPITGNENFDFLFTRSAVVGKNTTGYDAGRTGSTSIGFGYGIPLGKSLSLKFEPRATWSKAYYSAANIDSVFPSSDTSKTLISERMRVGYVEVPVSFKFKLARNLVDHYKLLVEAGFVFGLRVGSMYKTKHFADSTNFDGPFQPKVTNKINHINDLNRFRYGPFARIGTNWLSLYAFYRMSDVFRTDRKFTTAAGQQIAYPLFPRLEVGLTIAL